MSKTLFAAIVTLLSLGLSGCGMYRGEGFYSRWRGDDQIMLDGPVVGEPVVMPECCDMIPG